MNFFKRLFSPGKEKEIMPSEIKSVYTDEYFNKRYKEDDIYANPVLMDGCLRMIKSFFLDNKVTEKITAPLNHPINLDQAVTEGTGFHAYCKRFQLADGQITMFLAYAFSDFLIKMFGFKVYKDSEPEFPLRKMTLKYDRNGTVVSLYPVEYALKVLNNESAFDELFKRLNGKLQILPNYKDLLSDDTFLAEHKDLLKSIIDGNEKRDS